MEREAALEPYRPTHARPGLLKGGGTTGTGRIGFTWLRSRSGGRAQMPCRRMSHTINAPRNQGRFSSDFRNSITGVTFRAALTPSY